VGRGKCVVHRSFPSDFDDLFPALHASTVMSSNTEVALANTDTTVATKKAKKLKPARKQVKPGQVEKKEAPQTGKEYSTYHSRSSWLW
jgi:hypothetical protein